MFISRPSDPRTVLLWGDRWWFAGSDTALAFQNLAHAVEVLAAHLANEPKPIRLRLIYQPDAFASVAAACPAGDRGTLADALAADYPALGDPSCAWSHEPVLPWQEGHSTVLYFEREPGLFALAVQLARLGLAVDSAWPLGTFLQLLPEEWSESGAVTAVAIEAERAVAYRHSGDTRRMVLAWRGHGAIAEVGQWLRPILAQNAGEPLLLVFSDHEAAARLESHVTLEGHPGVEQISLGSALCRRAALPRYHPAQLLPRGPVITAERAVIAASLAFLCTAAWSGVTLAHEWRAARTEAHSQETRSAGLRAEIARLQVNASEIAALRSVIDSGAAGPPWGALLEQLAATTPPEIVLDALRVDGRNVELNGWLAPSSPSSALEAWRARLAPAPGPWTVNVRAGNGGAIRVTGAFTP